MKGSINQISMRFIACLATAGFSLLAEFSANEDIRGSFSFDGGRIRVVLENHGPRDIVVSGFFEGLRDATILKGAGSLPFISNHHELIRFDWMNRDVVWLRLRAILPSGYDLGSVFFLNEPVTNTKLLNYLKSNRGEDLVLQVRCRWAPLDGTELGKFTIVYLRLSHRTTEQNQNDQEDLPASK